MRKINYNATVIAKVSDEQRSALERYAAVRDISIGQAVRDLIKIGFAAVNAVSV
ncbi:MAG: hypothetical protein WB392_04865 [Methanotrichaceae archaeon]